MSTQRPRILYAGFATERHSGGVHVMTEHVELLITAGHHAQLWLPGPDRPTWINPEIPVIFGATTEVGGNDLLVLPEVPLIPGRDPAPGARKVIFNQNHFYTYAAADSTSDDAYPGWSVLPMVWAVSRESRDVLEALLPDLDVVLVPNPIDGELFRPGPALDRHRVTWFPRKRPRESSLLKRLLQHDPRFAGVELCELVGSPRAEVVQILGGTTVFVSMGHSESFGLTVAEALACGCLVVGYDGGGGQELFEAPGAWPIPEQRPLLLLDKIADLLARSDQLSAVRAANRSWVLERYPFERTSAALRSAVDQALTRPGQATTATHPAAWLGALGANFTAYA